MVIGLIFVGLAFTALPPGYQDKLLCPCGYCKTQKKIRPPPGPQASFVECTKEGSKALPVKTWGSKVNTAKQFDDWTKSGFHEIECTAKLSDAECADKEGSSFTSCDGKCKKTGETPGTACWKKVDAGDVESLCKCGVQKKAPACIEGTICYHFCEDKKACGIVMPGEVQCPTGTTCASRPANGVGVGIGPSVKICQKTKNTAGTTVSAAKETTAAATGTTGSAAKETTAAATGTTGSAAKETTAAATGTTGSAAKKTTAAVKDAGQVIKESDAAPHMPASQLLPSMVAGALWIMQ